MALSTELPVAGDRDQLVSRFPAGVLTTDQDIVASCAHDESRLSERNMPWAVASPATTDEVAQCMRLAAEARIPVGSGSFQSTPGTPTYSSISPWWLAGSGVLR